VSQVTEAWMYPLHGLGSRRPRVRDLNTMYADLAFENIVIKDFQAYRQCGQAYPRGW